jgi:hypothetical protein
MTEGRGFNPHEQRPLRRMQVTVVSDQEGRYAGERLLKVREAGKEPILIEVDNPTSYVPGSTLEFDWKAVTLRKNLTNSTAVYAGRIVEVALPAVPDALSVSRPPEVFGTLEAESVEERWPEEWFGREADSSQGIESDEGEDAQSVEVGERLAEEQSVPLSEERLKEFSSVEYAKGGFFARVGAERRYLSNAEELFLLPGDEVVLAPGEGSNNAVAAEVAYEGRSTVLGRLEYRGGTTTPELRFVVRTPNADGLLDKFRFRTEPVITGMNEEEILTIVKQRAYQFFDRNQMRVVGEPIPEDTMSSYDAAELSVLTNLGIKQHDEGAQSLLRGEQEQLAALLRTYGVPETVGGKAVSRAGARVTREKIAHDVKEGRVEDFRIGERITIAVDAKGTWKRDDAFTIGPSAHGEGWSEIGIHIADPRILIPAGSALDRGAAERSAGIFLPGTKIPMIPEAIATLGSLDEGEDRRAFALIFDAKLGPNEEGVEIRGIRFAPTAVRVGKAIDHDAADELLIGEGEPTEPYAKAWNTFAHVMNALNERGVIRKNSERTPKPLNDSDEIVATANTLFNRAAAEAFTRFKRSGQPRLQRLQNMALGTYRNAASQAGEPPVLEQSTTPRGNLYYGGQYAYLSSPLRDYSSIVGLRSLAFLADLAKRSKAGKDVSAPTARKLVERYARDVAGLPALSAETRAEPGDKFPSVVAGEARKHLDRVLKHALAREELIQRTERAMRSMKTLDTIGAKIQKEGPLDIPEGIRVEFSDRRNKPSLEDGVQWVYGYAKLTRKTNRFVYSFAPTRSDTLRVGVKFPLPRGMRFPEAPSEHMLQGRITGVDVEKGRLILDVQEGEKVPPRSSAQPRRR